MSCNANIVIEPKVCRAVVRFDHIQKDIDSCGLTYRKMPVYGGVLEKEYLFARPLKTQSLIDVISSDIALWLGREIVRLSAFDVRPTLHIEYSSCGVSFLRMEIRRESISRLAAHGRGVDVQFPSNAKSRTHILRIPVGLIRLLSQNGFSLKVEWR